MPGVVDEVADRDSHEHGADVGREIEAAELRESCGDIAAEADAEREHQKAEHKAVGVRGEVCVVGVLLVLAALGKLLAQMVFDNKMTGDGTAEDGTKNETEGRRRNGDGRSADRARGVEVGADGRGGAGPADHGDGAAAEAVERVFAHERHHAAADGVLQKDDDDAQREQQHHGSAALDKHGDAHGEADGGEEQDHEDRLERFVKGDDRKTGGIEQGVEQREAQSADKRSGHAEAPERRELSRQRRAEPVHNGAECEGMVHIELDLSHGVVPPVLCFFAGTEYAALRRKVG